jgi:hypothetical protein
VPSDVQAANEIDSCKEVTTTATSSEVADELRYAPEGNLGGYAKSEQATALVRHLAHKHLPVSSSSMTVMKRTPEG